jgi:hypothetical protein
VLLLRVRSAGAGRFSFFSPCETKHSAGRFNFFFSVQLESWVGFICCFDESSGPLLSARLRAVCSWTSPAARGFWQRAIRVGVRHAFLFMRFHKFSHVGKGTRRGSIATKKKEKNPREDLTLPSGFQIISNARGKRTRAKKNRQFDVRGCPREFSADV